MPESVFQGLHDNPTALTDLALALEGVGANPMAKSSRVLFHDTFEDGRYHGWRPVHFGSERPFNPLSVETDYPGPGLYMATSPTPYRAGAFGATVSTYRGLSGRLPTTGIVTFAGKFYIQSGGPDAYAWSAWGLEMDIQNWSDTKRSNPQWQCANPGDGTAARWQIRKSDGSFTSIGSTPTRTVNDGVVTNGSTTLTSATAAFTASDIGRKVVVTGGGSGGDLTTTIAAVTNATTVTLAAAAGTTGSGKTVAISTVNPANSTLSGVSATKGLTGGENENKWDENYIRVSFDLGDLFQITSGTPTAQYYEININGYRFDLRGEGGGSSNRTTQGGSALSSFKGGLNFGINLYRDTTSGSKVYPARLVAGDVVALYHETGWLS